MPDFLKKELLVLLEYKAYLQIHLMGTILITYIKILLDLFVVVLIGLGEVRIE